MSLAADSSHDVTRILQAASAGDSAAIDELMAVVYDELRALAGRYLRRERNDHTLQATALVHEAYLKLIGQQTVEWRDRAHFYSAAANVIRRLLVDHARRRNRLKRGGGQQRVAIEDVTPTDQRADIDLLALDAALAELATLHARQAQIVELRYFAGLAPDECAKLLDVSERTVYDDWKMAKAWLRRQMGATATDAYE